MEQREIKDKKNYVIAFIIGTFIFILIFLFTNYLSSLESDRIYSIQGEMAQDIFKDKLAYSLFEENSCSTESFGKISRDLGYAGKIIDVLEKKLGKEDQNVLEQKKFYTLILLEHFEFVKMYNKLCNASIPTILFFYSNKKEEADKNEEMGKILDALGTAHPEIVIYSFDINLNSDLIKKVMNKYHITSSPMIIINEDTLFGKVTNIKEIEQYLD